MNEENRKDKSKSSLRSDLDDLKGQLMSELDRLRNIVVSAEEDDILLSQQKKTPNNIHQEITEITSADYDLNEGIQEELTWKTAEIFFRILKKPDNKNKYLTLFDSFQDKENNKLIETVFDGEEVPSELFEKMESIINQFKTQYITKMRDEAFKFAQNIYSPKEFYLKIIEPIKNLGIEEISRKIDNLLDKSTDVFAMRDKFLAIIEKKAKTSNIETSINERYKTLREIFHSKQEYRVFIMAGWKISAGLGKILTKLLAEEEIIRSFYRVLFAKVSDINRSIIQEFTESEITRIFV